MIGAVPDQEARMSTAITTAAVVASLLVAAPASAHTIDVRVAADAVKASASALGELDRAKCWRPMIGTKRARHRAICAAWWVHTPGASCAIFYEARMAAHPSRRLLVIDLPALVRLGAARPDDRCAGPSRRRNRAGPLPLIGDR
jgi:hypothetical protein